MLSSLNSFTVRLSVAKKVVRASAPVGAKSARVPLTTSSCGAGSRARLSEKRVSVSVRLEPVARAIGGPPDQGGVHSVVPQPIRFHSVRVVLRVSPGRVTADAPGDEALRHTG